MTPTERRQHEQLVRALEQALVAYATACDAVVFAANASVEIKAAHAWASTAERVRALRIV